MMDLSNAVCLLFLFGALNEAAAVVNLTQLAEQYVVKQKSTGEIVRWGITEDYWKRGHHPSERYSIKARVKKLECLPEDPAGSGKQFGRPRYNCEEDYFFFVNEKISCPFQLFANFSFPMVGKSKLEGAKIISVDFNNKTTLWGEVRKLSHGSHVYEACDFIAEVEFTGWFSYYEKPKHLGVEDGKDIDVRVTELKNESEHLSVEGDALIYRVTGGYAESLCI
uniref:Putative da-p36 protein n=1 Tax=Rhipicephalus pulchellus TaxID=72859 RepID=L7LTZ8_RHIPC